MAIGYKDKTIHGIYSLIGYPNGSSVESAEYVGEKPTVELYTYINHYADTPKQRLKHTINLDITQLCYIGFGIIRLEYCRKCYMANGKSMESDELPAELLKLGLSNSSHEILLAFHGIIMAV